MNKWYARIDSVTSVIGITALFGMIAILFIQVICRYVFKAALAWPEEFSQYCFLISTYMGISMTMYRGKHIRICVAQTFLPKKMGRTLDIFSCVLTTVSLAFVPWLVWEATLEMYQTSMSAVCFYFPIWTIWSFILLGSICTFIQSIKRMMLVLFEGAEN